VPQHDGQALRAWRRSRSWDAPEMARQLRATARQARQPAASYEGLVRMIYRWERGSHALTERYALLYARTLGISPDDLARGPQPHDSPGTPPAGRTTVAGPPAAGNCESCGARLARDNPDTLCSACGRSAALRPPVLPREFWDTADMRAALDSWHIGHVIYAYRTHPRHARTLPQELIGKWLGHPAQPLTQPQVSRIETGPPTDDLGKLTRWAQILRIPPELLWFKLPADKAGLIPGQEAAGEAGPAPGPLSSPPPQATTASTAEAVKRREFLVGMAATVGFNAAGATAPASRRVDPELIPYFQQQLTGHYRADMLLGPSALISTVTAQCNLIVQLIDSADEPTRQRMAVVGTSFATFAAWLCLDAGDIAAAFRWHDTAQEMAHRSRDREAIACALVDRAMARTDQGKGAAVVDLCNAALMEAGHLSPELCVFALQQQAHGASLLGDRRQVDSLLDAAGRLLGQVDTEAWGTACLRTPHYIEVQRATCYGRLGLASEALRAWQQIIPAAPSTARRDIGVWIARQATLAASLQEPEQTVELARHAVKVALETGSARVRRELAAAEATMTPWQDEPVGQDFAEALAPISEGTQP